MTSKQANTAKAQKVTVTAAESRIDIIITKAGNEWFAMCSYPVQRTLKSRENPYAPGKGMMPARTPNVATTEEALKDMLDLLEKKMGVRPTVSGK